MAATRLRRTFAYPSESDDEDAVEAGMDEQDRTTLLTSLHTHDTRTTNIYTHLLLILPLAPSLLYVPRLFSLADFLPSVLALASLWASAYVLYFVRLPPQKGALGSASTSSRRDDDGPKVPWMPEEHAALIGRYILPVNIALCAVLGLEEFWQGTSRGEGFAVGGGYLPGLVLVVVVWARRELRAVDLGDLERLNDESKKS